MTERDIEMKKSRRLSPADEKLQNEIARRVKAGLPLAGLIAAALVGGGCEGFSRTSGDVPMTERQQQELRNPHVVGKMPASEEPEKTDGKTGKGIAK